MKTGESAHPCEARRLPRARAHSDVGFAGRVPALRRLPVHGAKHGLVDSEQRLLSSDCAVLRLRAMPRPGSKPGRVGAWQRRRLPLRSAHLAKRLVQPAPAAVLNFSTRARHAEKGQRALLTSRRADTLQSGISGACGPWRAASMSHRGGACRNSSRRSARGQLRAPSPRNDGALRGRTRQTLRRPLRGSGSSASELG